MSWIILCEFIEDFFLEVEFRKLIDTVNAVIDSIHFGENNTANGEVDKIITQAEAKETAYLSENFMPIYDLQDKSEQTVFLTCFYFAFTSLTTVGFGDFHPISEFE